MLYILNVYNIIYQFHLNKTVKKSFSSDTFSLYVAVGQTHLSNILTMKWAQPNTQTIKQMGYRCSAQNQVPQSCSRAVGYYYHWWFTHNRDSQMCPGTGMPGVSELYGLILGKYLRHHQPYTQLVALPLGGSRFRRHLQASQVSCGHEDTKHLKCVQFTLLNLRTSGSIENWRQPMMGLDVKSQSKYFNP